LFLQLDLSALDATVAATGRKGYSKQSLFAAFVVMKCEGFGYITDLQDYLENNRLIAYYCGFDVTKPLPSYWTYDRFIRELPNDALQQVMRTQVETLMNRGVLDTSFIGLDSTPVAANTANNNPKSFRKSKFSKEHPPRADKDCRLGVHTASNQHNEKRYAFYWGYKNHVLVDCITGLPISELTTTADVADSSVALDILSRTNSAFPLHECYFLADKGYDVKALYNTVRDVYHGNCFIPLNPRGMKDLKKLPVGNPICDAGLAMHRDGKFSEHGRTRQKFCCPFKRSHSPDAVCPCDHKCWNNGKKNRGCTKYVTIPDDYRLSIDRTSISFKSIYSLRTECERYNSRFKATGQERLWVRNFASAQNLNTTAHIALLAVALAAVVTAKISSCRSLKSALRSA
jgi:transposase DDE domain